MWSFYGRKARIARYYPHPIYNTIVEPFAGSAAYSLFGDNWKKEVVLIDIFPVVTNLWKYLQQAKPEDILRLPIPENGQLLSTLPGWDSFLQEEKDLIAFCSANATDHPRNVAGRMNYNSWWRDKHRIAKDLYKIKHWKIIENNYNYFDFLVDLEVTWFIDPPYQYGGKWYKDKIENYSELAKWCLSRKGQVIVCENTKADWLPFKPLVEITGQRHTKTTEAIYYKENN